MKIPPFLQWASALAVAGALLSPTVATAEDITPTVVMTPIPNRTVRSGTLHANVPLDDVFGLTGVGDQVVRFATSLGDVDVVMFYAAAPINVSNFLLYADSGSYSNSFFHRSVQQSGLAILQGGGYYVENDQVMTVATDPPVVNEFNVPNVRSTLAMAKTSDPDSATSQWFFNVQDNSTALDDPNNSGGFTVIGAVITDGMAVVDALAALRTFNAGQAFTDLPVLDSYAGGEIQLSDLVYVNGVARVPMIPTTSDPNELSLLKLTVAKNSNKNLVTARIIGNQLRLTYKKGTMGKSTITVRATNNAGSIAETSFIVTVKK